MNEVCPLKKFFCILGPHCILEFVLSCIKLSLIAQYGWFLCLTDRLTPGQ